MGCTVMREVEIDAGGLAEWEALSGFHYRAGRPGVVERVWAAWWDGRGRAWPRTESNESSERAADGGEAAESAECVPAGAETSLRADGRRRVLAGVVVVGRPVLNCGLRDVATGGRYVMADQRARAAALNRELRCISRVVVHPRFRGMGLGVRLVRHALDRAETPYVEALAAMGRMHPFFERAGMRRYERGPDAQTLRMERALACVGLRAVELCDGRLWRAKLAAADADERRFIEREMRRYCSRRGGAGPLAELVATVRRRVLSWPVYYLWRRGDQSALGGAADEGAEAWRVSGGTGGTEEAAARGGAGTGVPHSGHRACGKYKREETLGDTATEL